MKRFHFNTFLLTGLLMLLASGVPARSADRPDSDTIRHATRRWDKRIHLKYHYWERLKPTQVKLQYAGGMGMFAIGAGWDYGRRCQWETDFLWGFLPKKYGGGDTRFTFTVKQNYIPWSISIDRHWALEPFCCGLYVTTITGDEFWKKEPGKYPNKYYNFSTKLRPYIFIGQRFGFNPLHNLVRNVSVYYEISSCELYLISKFTNRSLSMKDILRFSFGVKMQLFRD